MDYNKVFEERLSQTRKKAQESPLYGEFAVRMISDKKLDEIRKMITEITGKKVWTDLYWNTGNITGILRSVFNERKHRNEIYEKTPITKAMIDQYYKVVGNLPYCDTKTIDPTTSKYVVNPGRPMDIKGTKELIIVVAATFGVLVEESDLDDLNQERIDYIYASRLAQAQETAETAEAVAMYQE